MVGAVGFAAVAQVAHGEEEEDPYPRGLPTFFRKGAKHGTKETKRLTLKELMKIQEDGNQLRRKYEHERQLTERVWKDFEEKSPEELEDMYIDDPDAYDKYIEDFQERTFQERLREVTRRGQRVARYGEAALDPKYQKRLEAVALGKAPPAKPKPTFVPTDYRGKGKKYELEWEDAKRLATDEAGPDGAVPDRAKWLQGKRIEVPELPADLEFELDPEKAKGWFKSRVNKPYRTRPFRQPKHDEDMLPKFIKDGETGFDRMAKENWASQGMHNFPVPEPLLRTRKLISKFSDIQRIGIGPVVELHSIGFPANDPIEDTTAFRHRLHRAKGSLFGVFDGHSGGAASKFCRDHLFDILEYRYQECDAKKPLLDAESFLEADRVFLDTNWADGDYAAGNSGACAVVCHLDKNKLRTAWAGDCRAIVGRKSYSWKNRFQAWMFGIQPRELNTDLQWHWEADELTRDHDLSNMDEEKRVLREHPDESDVTRRDRIKGRLQPTRGIGDGKYKRMGYFIKSKLSGYLRYLKSGWFPPYTTAEPEISERELDADDMFIVLASDGLFDHLSSQDVIESVGDYLSRYPSSEIKGHTAASWVTEKALAKSALMDQKHAIYPRRMYLNWMLTKVPIGKERRRKHDDISVQVVLLDRSDVGQLENKPLRRRIKMPDIMRRARKLREEKSDRASFGEGEPRPPAPEPTADDLWRPPPGQMPLNRLKKVNDVTPRPPKTKLGERAINLEEDTYESALLPQMKRDELREAYIRAEAQGKRDEFEKAWQEYQDSNPKAMDPWLPPEPAPVPEPPEPPMYEETESTETEEFSGAKTAVKDLEPSMEARGSNGDGKSLFARLTSLFLGN